MGRRGRQRKLRHKKSNFPTYSLEHNSEIISLNRWIKANGFQKCKKINLGNFEHTGRGVRAMENIVAGDVLLEIPFNLILNMCTLQSDINFTKLFSHQKDDSNSSMFTCQEILSFYISYLKINYCQCTLWSDYIHTLPIIFQMPYFCSDDESKYFDDSVGDIVKNQKINIRKSFNHFKNILINCSLQEIESTLNIPALIAKFTLNVFEWSYFVVNSRCVYLDPNIIQNVLNSQILQSDSHYSFSSNLKDSPSLGLIPYLDMFNHSSNAKTDAILTFKSLRQSLENDNSIHLNSFKIHDLYFELKTLSPASKYHQIFISYGEHCNLKLYTEYGFCLPSNRLTYVTFLFSNICQDMKHQKNIVMTKEKYQYILKHGIFKNLCITRTGYNYNFIRLLFILISNEKNIWDTKIYSNNYSESEISHMLQISKVLIQSKCDYITSVLNDATSTHSNNTNFVIFMDLMREYNDIVNSGSIINS